MAQAIPKPPPTRGAQIPLLTDYEKYLRRKSSLDLNRSSYMTHWRDINSFLAPRTGRFMATDVNKGQPKHQHIYDNTASRAHRVLVAGLMAGSSSPARPWFRVTTPDPEMAEGAAVKEWLFKLSTLMRLIFAKSNTYRALPQIYRELSGYATAATIIEPDFENVIHHHMQTIGEYMLAANEKGVIDTICREFQMPVGSMVAKFGYENCSRAARNLYDQYNYESLVTVVHLIQPRVLAKRDLAKRDDKNMPWMSVYLELGEDSGVERKLLRESGYKAFPALTPRWETVGLDAYGSNCPGMSSLGDIKELQHDKKQRSKAVDYMADPPVQMPTSMRNQENDLLPGGVSYTDTSGPGSGIRSAFEVPLNLQHLDAGTQDTRQRINSDFFADLFLMLVNDQRSGTTAREIAERHEEKLLMLGPVLESVHNELLGPMIDLTFDRIIEAGMLPPPPEELQDQELKIEFVSMLAQAQKAVGLSSVDRLLGTVGIIAQSQMAAGGSPDAFDKVDTDAVIDNYADMLGVDPDLIIANDDVAIVRDERNKAAAAAQARAQVPEQAQTAKTLSETNTQDPSGLTDVMNMFSQ